MFFPAFFFTQQKFGPNRVTGVYVWTESRTHSGKKLITSGEFGDLADLLCLPMSVQLT